MRDWQKMGGIAALGMAATFMVGIAVFLGVLVPAGYFDAGVDPAEKVAILADNQAIASVSYLTAFVVFGALLVVLSLALHERLKKGAPAMAQIATAFGLIWAALVMASGMVANVGIAAVVDVAGRDPVQAGSTWLAVETVQLGLGGGNEIPGGLWVLLISWAAVQAGGLPRALSYLGMVIGVAGLATVLPALEALGFLFGLGLIVWFIWVGILLLRERQRPGVTGHHP